MIFDKYEKLGAYHWDWYEDPNYAWYKECVDKIVKFCKGSTYDAGCGDGLVLQKIIDNGFDAAGCDDDIYATDICVSKKLRVDSIDLEEDDSGLEDWDYMCCLNVIEHLKSPNSIIQMVRDADKGAIIITDKPTGNVGRYHEHEYTKEELLDTFKEFKPKYFEIHSTEHGKPITFHGVEIIK